MPVYEITLRYDAPDDQSAMRAGIRLETELRQPEVQRRLRIPGLMIERLCRLTVTKMELVQTEWWEL